MENASEQNQTSQFQSSPILDQNIPHLNQPFFEPKTSLQNNGNATLFKSLLFFIIVFLTILILIRLNLQKKTVSQQQSATSRQSISRKIELKIDNSEIKNAFVKGYPDFDKLVIGDLSGLQDIRQVFNYKNDLIVTGYPSILEIDNEKDVLIRRLSSNVLPCTNEATKIDNFIYVVCYSSTDYYGIFKLDLKTGSIVKSYKNFQYNIDKRDTRDFTFTNSTITHLGNVLWLGGIEGAISINTETDEVKLYNPEDIGYTTNNGYRVFANGKFIWVATNDAVHANASVYNSQTDIWSVITQDQIAKVTGLPQSLFNTFGYSQDKAYFVNEYKDNEPITIVEYSPENGLKKVVTVDSTKMKELQDKYKSLGFNNNIDLRNEYLTDVVVATGGDYLDTALNKPTFFQWPKDKIPSFSAMSNRSTDTYYLASNQSIWRLERGQDFPALFYSYSPSNFGINSIYVTKDGTTLILIGTDETSYPDFYPKIYLLDVKTKTMTEISGTKEQYMSLSDSEKAKYNSLTSSQFQEDSNLVQLLSTTSGGVIIEMGEVNLKIKTFTLK